MTASQNVWDWKGTSRHHLARNSGLKRYHLQPRTMSLWILSKDGESNLCKCSVSLTVKKCFLMCRENLLCYFVPIVSGPITGQWWENSGLDFSAQLLQVFIKIEPSLLQAIKSQLSAFCH